MLVNRNVLSEFFRSLLTENCARSEIFQSNARYPIRRLQYATGHIYIS